MAPSATIVWFDYLFKTRPETKPKLMSSFYTIFDIKITATSDRYQIYSNFAENTVRFKSLSN